MMQQAHDDLSVVYCEKLEKEDAMKMGGRGRMESGKKITVYYQMSYP
jgi:hypothetical protein